MKRTIPRYPMLASPLNLHLHDVIEASSFTLESKHIDKVVCVDSAGNSTITIPNDETLMNIAVGQETHLIQIGAGDLTVAAGSGVTVIDPYTSSNSKFIRLKKSAVDEWLILQSQ